jgi:hypothetical protein
MVISDGTVPLSYLEAKRKAQTLQVTGLLAAAPLLVTCIVSVLLMIYHRLDTGSQFSAAIAKPFKQLVFNAYDKTRFLELFWAHSPIPNPMQLSDVQNLYFGIVYICLLAALSMVGAGSQIKRKLRKVDQQIEEQLILESIRGERTRSVHEVRSSIPLAQEGWWKALHSYYVAPIIGAVIAGLILRMVFGIG